MNEEMEKCMILNENVPNIQFNRDGVHAAFKANTHQCVNTLQSEMERDATKVPQQIQTSDRVSVLQTLHELQI